MKLIIVFLTLVFLLNIKTSAATGCLSNNTEFTYINRTGSNYFGVTEFYHRGEFDRRTTASNFCTTPVVPTRSCYINSTRSGFSDSYGTLVNYETSACEVPLDGYELAMLFGIGLLSITLIRNKYIVG